MKWRQTKSNSTNTGTRQVCLLSPYLLNIVLEVPENNKTTKGGKGIQIRKEEIKVLFADDMIVCNKRPKKFYQGTPTANKHLH